MEAAVPLGTKGISKDGVPPRYPGEIKIVCPVDDLGMQKNNERHSKKITSISEWISTRKTQIGGKFSLGGTISDKLTRLRAQCKQYGVHITLTTQLSAR